MNGRIKSLSHRGNGKNILGEGGGGGDKKIIEEQDKDFAPKTRIVIQSSYLLVFGRGCGLPMKRSKGMGMWEGLLRLWKKKKRMGGRRKRGTNAREGRTIKLALCLIKDISLYQVDRLGGMMLWMTNTLGRRGGGEGIHECSMQQNGQQQQCHCKRCVCVVHLAQWWSFAHHWLQFVTGAYIWRRGDNRFDVETLTYLALCNAGIVHRHIGQFINGHVEGQLGGYVPVTSDDLVDVNISLSIAREMAIVTSLTITSSPWAEAPCCTACSG